MHVGKTTEPNAYNIANALRMWRTQEKHRSVLLVEGDSDVRLYSKLVDTARCKIQPAGNRVVALDALRMLKTSRFEGVLAVIDADLDHADGCAVPDDDVVFPETPDHEGLLIQSEALRSILHENDIDLNEAQVGDFRDKVRDAATSIGSIRLYSRHREDILSFEGLMYDSFFDPSSISVDPDKLASAVMKRNGSCRIRHEELIEAVVSTRPRFSASWNLCRGHDMTQILASVIRHRASKVKAKHKSASDVESQLRLAFQLSHFVRTEIHTKIRRWETKNSPFSIFRNESELALREG
jgi:hypothetical protein